MAPNFLLMIICTLAALIIDLSINFDLAPPILSLALLASIMPVVWLTTVRFIKHPIYFEILPILNTIFSRKKTPK
jgi:hypothetical protein